MAFSSFSAYLDHPNLHQLQQSGLQQGGAGGSGSLLENRQLLNGPHPPSAVAGGGLASIRPGSMVDRARIAKIPLPEAGLKCPRCESTHTKFCYFNNYSLTQPRHFCKNCRRYWTRGGALRNVPVGGGCRRNKRSKGGANNNGSKSGAAPNLERIKPAAMDGGSGGGGSTSSSVSPTNITGHFPQLTLPPQITTPSFQSLTHYEGNNGFHQHPLVVTSGGGGGGGGIGELGFQFPFLGGYHDLLGVSSHSNLYPNFSMAETNPPSLSSSAPKMEETRAGFNSSTKHFLGTMENNNNHYWGWTGGAVGFSGLNASSPTTHELL